MTKEQALEVQASILDKIKDYIPDAVVSPLWSVYRDIKGLRPDTPAPCSCEGGKTWNPIIQTVREAVQESLVEPTIIEEAIQSIQTVEDNVSDPKQTPKKSYYKKKA